MLTHRFSLDKTYCEPQAPQPDIKVQKSAKLPHETAIPSQQTTNRRQNNSPTCRPRHYGRVAFQYLTIHATRDSTPQDIESLTATARRTTARGTRSRGHRNMITCSWNLPLIHPTQSTPLHLIPPHYTPACILYILDTPVPAAPRAITR